MQAPETIIYRASHYVTRLLIEQLPADRLFHNLHHTTNVIRGVLDIGCTEHLTTDQWEILLLAAWFHDSGHTTAYHEHEAASQSIARRFLEAEHYPADKLQEVLDCIGATQLPQRPHTLLQRILCDADLYHLSLPAYDNIQELLREEWRRALNIKFTDAEWKTENLRFLHDHRYFTTYGQTVLQKKKEEQGAIFRNNC